MGKRHPKEEFFYSEDLTDACVFVMKSDSGEMFLNVETRHDMAILEQAESIADVVRWKRTVTFDLSKPNGVPAE